MGEAKTLKISEIFRDGARPARALERYYSNKGHEHLYGGRFFEQIARSDPRRGTNGEGEAANFSTASEILAVTALSVDVPPTGVDLLLNDEHYSE